jgi:hypothetical protein
VNRCSRRPARSAQSSRHALERSRYACATNRGFPLTTHQSSCWACSAAVVSSFRFRRSPRSGSSPLGARRLCPARAHDPTNPRGRRGAPFGRSARKPSDARTGNSCRRCLLRLFCTEAASALRTRRSTSVSPQGDRQPAHPTVCATPTVRSPHRRPTIQLELPGAPTGHLHGGVTA